MANSSSSNSNGLVPTEHTEDGLAATDASQPQQLSHAGVQYSENHADPHCGARHGVETHVLATANELGNPNSTSADQQTAHNGDRAGSQNEDSNNEDDVLSSRGPPVQKPGNNGRPGNEESKQPCQSSQEASTAAAAAADEALAAAAQLAQEAAATSAADQQNSSGSLTTLQPPLDGKGAGQFSDASTGTHASAEEPVNGSCCRPEDLPSTLRPPQPQRQPQQHQPQQPQPHQQQPRSHDQQPQEQPQAGRMLQSDAATGVVGVDAARSLQGEHNECGAQYRSQDCAASPRSGGEQQEAEQSVDAGPSRRRHYWGQVRPPCRQRVLCNLTEVKQAMHSLQACLQMV